MIRVSLHPSSATTERAQRVITALEAQGVDFQPGDDDALGRDHPVLMFWPREMAASALVIDDQTLAVAASGRFISVLVEKTALPEELPKHPTIDLVGWRGSPRNAYFGDLLSALRAATNKAPPPKPRGPTMRLLARLCQGLTTAAILTFLIGFALNLLELQNNLCSIGFNQPGLSDFCGKYGLGDKPTKQERVAWSSIPPGRCEALRDHMDLFPDGVFHTRAADRLEARRYFVEERWEPDQQRSVFSRSIATDAVADIEVAKADALAAGQEQAADTCRAFAATDFYKHVSTDLELKSWDCFSTGDGHYCGFDGYKTCNLERLVKTRREVCGEVE